MLICKDLLLRQDAFHLRADVSFARGAVTALIGPSGAGKSTLLAALAGFFAPAGGQILWQGQDLTPLAPAARPISAVFQDHNLFAHLTVAQNVGLALAPRLRLRADQRAAVAAALAAVGLAGLGGRKPAALSGGQQSRAALARVLLADRPVVLLDEPFAALGPRLKDEMLDLVQATLVQAGRCVVMVTHDPQDAQRIAAFTAFVGVGQVQAPQPTQDFFANPSAGLADYLR